MKLEEPEDYEKKYNELLKSYNNLLKMVKIPETLKDFSGEFDDLQVSLTVKNMVYSNDQNKLQIPKFIEECFNNPHINWKDGDKIFIADYINIWKMIFPYEKKQLANTTKGIISNLLQEKKPDERFKRENGREYVIINKAYLIKKVKDNYEYDMFYTD